MEVMPLSGSPAKYPFPLARKTPKPLEWSGHQLGVQGREALEAECTAAHQL